MSNVIKTFGIWQVTDDGIESTGPAPYEISVPGLFESREEKAGEVWEYPIHLTEKSWASGANARNLDDFNDAFAFAQDHFKADRPASKANVSDKLTYAIQRQMRR